MNILQHNRKKNLIYNVLFLPPPHPQEATFGCPAGAKPFVTKYFLAQAKGGSWGGHLPDSSVLSENLDSPLCQVIICVSNSIAFSHLCRYLDLWQIQKFS